MSAAAKNARFLKFLNEKESVRLLRLFSPSHVETYVCPPDVLNLTLPFFPRFPRDLLQKGRTALLMSVEGGRLDAVQVLLEFGADPNIGDNVRSHLILLALTTLPFGPHFRPLCACQSQCSANLSFLTD